MARRLYTLFTILLLWNVAEADKRKRARRRPQQQQQQPNLGGMVDFGGLGDILGALSGAAEQKKDGTCPTACPEGQFPVPKHRIRPYSNGCSVPDSLRDGLGDYRHFEPCCDLHDACYFSCGVPKPYCEEEFNKCMQTTCKERPTRKLQKDCESMAALFTVGTTLFGCGGYKELQVEGCECVDTSEDAGERLREYAHEFYAAFNQTHTLPDKFLNKYLQHEATTTTATRISKHGEMVFKLYKKYPKSIELISRDGKSGRKHESRFPAVERLASNEL